MKIIQLTAENVKKLTAVEITPDGNLVQITGKNGQGKSSVLDSIWWALAGTENIQKQPIRAGAESARIELKLGHGKTVELIVERRFTDKASYLQVKTADGAKYPSPQKLMDDIIGTLTFDPLGFMRSKPREQFELLSGLVTLDVDLDALDAANEADFKRRTDINRDAKTKRAQAEAISVAGDLPAETINERALLDALQDAADTNAKIEQRKANREAAWTKINGLLTEAERLSGSIAPDVEALARRRDQEVDDLQNQIDVLTRRMADVRARAETEAKELTGARTAAAKAAEEEARELKAKVEAAGELPESVDVAALRSELDNAQRTNRLIAERDRRAGLAQEAEALEAQSGALTQAMADRETKKAEAIAGANMPIDGLGFGAGSVTFKGLPLEQASDAEQLTVSTAIAAALNPKLRVLRIRDGSLLDDDAIARLAAFADERDMQIWIERVDGSGTVGIVMEDGHVKGQHAAEEAVTATESAGDPANETKSDAAYTDAEEMVRRWCAVFADPEMATMDDIDDFKARGLAAINERSITPEQKSALLGRLNTAYLERAKKFGGKKKAAA